MICRGLKRKEGTKWSVFLQRFGRKKKVAVECGCGRVFFWIFFLMISVPISPLFIALCDLLRSAEAVEDSSTLALVATDCNRSNKFLFSATISIADSPSHCFQRTPDAPRSRSKTPSSFLHFLRCKPISRVKEIRRIKSTVKTVFNVWEEDEQ